MSVTLKEMLDHMFSDAGKFIKKHAPFFWFVLIFSTVLFLMAIYFSGFAYPGRYKYIAEYRVFLRIDTLTGQTWLLNEPQNRWEKNTVDEDEKVRIVVQKEYVKIPAPPPGFELEENNK